MFVASCLSRGLYNQTFLPVEYKYAHKRLLTAKNSYKDVTLADKLTKLGLTES